MCIKLQRGLFRGNGKLTQSFGENPSWYEKFGLLGHNGIDYGISEGTVLTSCIDGVVTESEYDKSGYGHYVKIENDQCGVLYAHLSARTDCKVGDKVKASNVIGLSGNTGNSTGPHLHFAVFPKPRNRNNGYNGYIDPLDAEQVEWVNFLHHAVATNQVLEANLAVPEGMLEMNREEVLEVQKDVLWESIKEPLRLLVLAIIPFAVAYFSDLSYEWAGVLVLLLRGVDKFLHLTRTDETKAGGLTNF